MKKYFVIVLMITAVVCVAVNNKYMIKKNADVSSLVLTNIEALADSNEIPSTECIGCSYVSFDICRTFGDWGACLGKNISYN